MSLSLSQAIICLFLVICTFYQANSQDISIIRGKKDIFTNISGCQKSKAVCYRGSGKNCTYCQCKNETMTFIQRSNGYGECIPNERLANTTSVRCETFADGSSLVILNKTSNCEKKCLAEKETNVNGKNITECFLLQDQTQYLHKDKWKTLSFHKDSLDVVTNKTKVLLKWNLSKTPDSWRGLIVKAQFQCKSDGEEQNKESFCVLIKYTGEFSGFGNRDKTDNSLTFAIVVSLLVIAFVVGVLIFLVYKNKSRLINFIERNEAKCVTRNVPRNNPTLPTSGASNNPIYGISDTRSAQKNCELYEATEPEPVYHYAYAGYANKAQQPPNVINYYATPGEELKIGQGACNRKGGHRENVVSQNATAPQNVESPPVYHVLERS